MDKHSTDIKSIISTHSPLVEMMVEVQWGAPVITQAGWFSGDSSSVIAHEELYKKFSDKVEKDGFNQSERMIPNGFPITPFQEVYRYQKNLPEKGVIIYKLGPGIFSVNVSSPNQSWKEDFYPLVKKAMSLLLDNRSLNEKDEPFHHIRLRYLNLFDKRFTGGLPIINIFNVLGFKIELPHSLIEKLNPLSQIKPQLCISIPLKSKQEVILELTELSKSDEEAILMDLMLIDKQKYSPEIEFIMLALKNAHQVLKEIFLEVMGKILNLVKV